MASVEPILLPDIGDFAEVEIIEILVTPGDRIEAQQSILTLESDKATMEIPAPRGGLVKELLVKVGDKVGLGHPLLTLETDGAPAEAPSPAAPPPAATTAAPTPTAAPAAKASARPAAGETISVVLPDIGDYSDVPVIEILVKPGDRIAVDQSVLTLESDKATMEIPSPSAGVVEGVAVKLGDKLSQGDLILTLKADADGAADTASAPAAAPTPQPAPAASVAPTTGTAAPTPAPAQIQAAPDPAATGRKPHASPSVRLFARELGVNLTLVARQRAQGPNPQGRRPELRQAHPGPAHGSGPHRGRPALRPDGRR